MASQNIIIASRRLAEKGLKIAFAESATAGWLASEFALTPTSGGVLLGGIVCYDACTKEELFDIPQEIIDRYTPESAEVTRLLAERLTKFFKCDVAVAITGLTAPGGSETDEKPVGTMFIHIKLPEDRYCAHREVFEGDPKDIIGQTIERVGELITEHVDKIEMATAQDTKQT
ncbi:CinA family protein [Flavobacterium subsaxonicum]|uniref:Damage-inducible protein CinA n=1 Tax=Flavobacterium subsaxonicum WB 4.1-42 = DSM 21790 TaxID=1121898 RepID=A0A0A2MPQ3_9FLAO|nr:CinA family protein [Flavobacterium subsaxonicum]KGO94304.1 damage-inducible protein CinA [Flavobacterium subsaxonicum WB 4.1-42 = DSM 21790]